MNNSVVSAAIIEGNLIIGLSDGSVINCGFVQGPQGLSGPQGPMGATGDNGTDGNTIITVGGTPGNEMGSDGDYAIDNINWRIYGPKSGGVWGKAKEMLPGPENILENGRAPSGSGGGSMGGSGSGGDGGGIIYTNTVQLTNPTTTLLRSSANYKIIPNAPTGTTNQEDANLWGFGACFDNFDAAIPVPTGVLPPDPLPGFIDNYDGRLWFNSSSNDLTLYVYKNKQWVPTFPPITFVNLSPTPPVRPDRPSGPNDGDLWFDTSPDELTLYVYSADSGAWIPAAPPTTLEGRVAENEALQIEIVQRLQANDVLTNFHSSEIETIKNDIIELEEEIDALAPAVQRGNWTFTPTGTVAQKGQFTMYDGTFGNGAPTNVFQDVRSIWLNELDNAGTPHGFGNVRAGDLIEVFVEGAAEYGLYSVFGLPNDESDGPAPYWSLDVSFIRTLNDNASIDAGTICRFKIFNPPGGGEGSEYVLRSGDRIEGELSWYAYKAEADGNPAENVYQGIKMFAREGGSKYLLYASTGAKYSPEELSTDVTPTAAKSITNKGYVDGVVKTVSDDIDTLIEVQTADTRVLQRTVDNLDFLSNTVSSGNYVRNNKTLSPPPTGATYLLQDGGAEATTFASVQNLLINKTGIGPYADFSFTRIGDTISLQNRDDVFFGLYVVKGITDFGTFWDLDIDVQGSKALGNAAVSGKQIAVRVTRFRPSVAQADPPLLSESGQLWYDTVNNRLNVWDQEDEEFHGVGGDGGGGGFTPGQKVAADSADDAVKGGFYLSGGNLYVKTL